MKRSFLMGMLLLVAAMASTVALSERASAQFNDPNCCSYFVDIQGVVPGCFDLKLTTRWDPFPPSVSVPVLSNGFHTYPIAPPDFNPCPPAPQFQWASLDGGVTIASYNNPKLFKVGRCCLWVRIGLDQNGCVVITIRPDTQPC